MVDTNLTKYEIRDIRDRQTPYTTTDARINARSAKADVTGEKRIYGHNCRKVFGGITLSKKDE